MARDTTKYSFDDSLKPTKGVAEGAAHKLLQLGEDFKNPETQEAVRKSVGRVIGEEPTYEQMAEGTDYLAQASKSREKRAQFMQEAANPESMPMSTAIAMGLINLASTGIGAAIGGVEGAAIGSRTGLQESGKLQESWQAQADRRQKGLIAQGQAEGDAHGDILAEGKFDQDRRLAEITGEANALKEKELKAERDRNYDLDKAKFGADSAYKARLLQIRQQEANTKSMGSKGPGSKGSLTGNQIDKDYQKSSDIIESSAFAEQELAAIAARFDAKATSGFFEPGPIAALGGVKAKFDPDWQQMQADFKKLDLDKIMSFVKQAGARAADSDTEGKAIRQSNPSLEYDKNVSFGLMTGTKIALQRAQIYHKAKMKAREEADGQPLNFKNPFEGTRAVVGPGMDVKFVMNTKADLKEAAARGYFLPDDYVKRHKWGSLSKEQRPQQ